MNIEVYLHLLILCTTFKNLTATRVDKSPLNIFIVFSRLYPIEHDFVNIKRNQNTILKTLEEIINMYR